MGFIKNTFREMMLIVITHDEKIAHRCDKIIYMGGKEKDEW